ncbi:hypothetical protein [Rhodospira trueperi]|uniref:Uncharacterized protein n=1 Tax=Rhodospira trueperi TaxID=69960 RepID=A0A1G7EX68_9PROT|nr:hypothetical protein [Rhodospira trueperi]SDE67965.1 hypothetical protein SAMN05421720_1107 [Rhodospira trueperi]
MLVIAAGRRAVLGGERAPFDNTAHLPLVFLPSLDRQADPPDPACRALRASARSIEYITAQGTGFGQSDGFALFSHLKDGRVRFRVRSQGQWMISVNHKEDVTPNGPLADLVGKADQVYHGATLTFSVR